MMSIEAGDRWSFAVPLQLLGARTFVSITLSDSSSTGAEDEPLPTDSGFYQWPMSCDDGFRNQGETGVDCGGDTCLSCGPIEIDGRSDDWDNHLPNSFEIEGHNPFGNVTYTNDENWIYLLLEMEDDIDTSRYRYQIFIGVRGDKADPPAAIPVNYGVMDARFMLDSGKLYRYSGAKGSWNWSATSPAFEDARWAITESGRSAEVRISRKAVPATNGTRVVFTIGVTEFAKSTATLWMPAKGGCFDNTGTQYHVDLGASASNTRDDMLFFGVTFGVVAVVCIAVAAVLIKYLLRKARLIRPGSSDNVVVPTAKYPKQLRANFEF